MKMLRSESHNAEVTVKSDVIRAYQNFNDTKTAYGAANAQLKAAELTYKMEKERYDLGISTMVQADHHQSGIC
jgi:outer membrane protein TolC